MELLKPYLDMEDFNMENAKKVCSDVAGLANWTLAMSFFFGINREVLPLKVSGSRSRWYNTKTPQGPMFRIKHKQN